MVGSFPKLVVMIVHITVFAVECAVLLRGNNLNSHEFESEPDTRDLSAMDLIVSANKDAGLHLIEGDIVPKKKRNAVAVEAWKWKGNEVPYIIDNTGFSDYGISVINEAIAQFNHDVTCMIYIPRTNEEDYVRIKHGYGCHSSIGRDGGRQDITLGDNCYYKGVVMHELTHAVGFFHEQSRWDRDLYIKVNMQNVMDGKEDDFRREQKNILDTLNAPYDYGSVMHYGSNTFSKNGQPTLSAIYDDHGTMGQRDGFSDVDIWKINKLYGCASASPPKPIWMKVSSTLFSPSTTIKPSSSKLSSETPSTTSPTTSSTKPTASSSPKQSTADITSSVAQTPASPSSSRLTPSTSPTTSVTTAPSVHPVTCLQNPNLPPGIFQPPSKFDVAVFPSSLRVFWDRPCYYKQISSYLLTYWTVGGKKISVHIDRSKLTHYISTADHPGRKFYMTIATETPAGVGPHSPVIDTFSACGQEVVLPDKGIYDKIHSPYFSQGYYEPDVACQWTIAAPQGQRLKVEFDTLNIETGSNCDMDMVLVNDVIFCSNIPQKGYIFTDSDTAKITFVSKPSSSNKHGGFHFFVSVDGIQPKNVTTTTVPGLIHVFWNAPEGVNNNSFTYELKYRLLPETHESAIHLDAHHNHFPIATGGHYGRQYEVDVSTIEGGRKGQPAMFHVRTACGRNTSASSGGTLHSPHYPSQYEPDTVCEWTLTIEDGYELVLTFTDLQLQSTPDCLSDFVEISGAGRFCSTSDLFGNIVLGERQTKIRFESDGALQQKGFELSYQQRQRM